MHVNMWNTEWGPYSQTFIFYLIYSLFSFKTDYNASFWVWAYFKQEYNRYVWAQSHVDVDTEFWAPGEPRTRHLNGYMSPPHYKLRAKHWTHRLPYLCQLRYPNNWSFEPVTFEVLIGIGNCVNEGSNERRNRHKRCHHLVCRFH